MIDRIRLAAALGAVAAAAALGASPAKAGLLVPSARDCPALTATTPFAPWLDVAHYVPVPDGGFEAGGAGWQLQGETAPSANEPWHVGSAADRRGLAVRGGSVTTPGVCVGLGHPTIRFFARNTGSATGALAVEVLVRTSLGARLALPIGVVVDPAGRWAPTLPMPVVANLLPLLPAERTTVTFRFTAVGDDSAWEVDDVYVDPYSKR